jgi:hypothetical protein
MTDPLSRADLALKAADEFFDLASLCADLETLAEKLVHVDDVARDLLQGRFIQAVMRA